MLLLRELEAVCTSDPRVVLALRFGEGAHSQHSPLASLNRVCGLIMETLSLCVVCGRGAHRSCGKRQRHAARPLGVQAMSCAGLDMSCTVHLVEYKHVLCCHFMIAPPPSHSSSPRPLDQPPTLPSAPRPCHPTSSQQDAAPPLP